MGNVTAHGECDLQKFVCEWLWGSFDCMTAYGELTAYGVVHIYSSYYFPGVQYTTNNGSWTEATPITAELQRIHSLNLLQLIHQSIKTLLMFLPVSIRHGAQAKGLLKSIPPVVESKQNTHIKAISRKTTTIALHTDVFPSDSPTRILYFFSLFRYTLSFEAITNVLTAFA